MPANARKDIVRAGEIGTYHCWSRCVQRAFLCGYDPVTERDFDCRRGWIESLLAYLAGVFALDVGNFNILSNHLHALFAHPSGSGPAVVRRGSGVALETGLARTVRRTVGARAHGCRARRVPDPAHQDRATAQSSQFRMALSRWNMCQVHCLRSPRRNWVLGFCING